MPFVSTERTAKVAMEFLWVAQQCAMTFWFEHPAAEPLEADLIALATYIGDNHWNGIKTQHSANIALTRVTATNQLTANAGQGSYIPGSPVPGTGGAGSLSLNDTFCMTYRTGLRGRNYRGRGYPPGLSDGYQSDPGHGYLAQLVTYSSALVTNLITNLPPEWQWVIVSHFLNKVARPIGVKTLVTGVTVDTLMDSMRRRLVGRGS